MFNSLRRWANSFSRRLLQLFQKASWSVTTAALNLSDDECESQLNCSLHICVFMTYRKQTPSWLWTLLAISSSSACMHSFWLWISGKPRLESSGLPSKTFEMLQMWPARDAATRSLVNVNVLYSWIIVRRVKWTCSSREGTAWIATCGWWLLSQPWGLNLFSFVVGSMLANLCTSKLDLQNPQWGNTNNTDFCKTKVISRTCSKSCMRRPYFGQANNM